MNLLKRKSESPFRFQPPRAAVMGSSLLSEVSGGSGWSILDLPDAEIPAALHAINMRFRELPGFPGLSLGSVPDYQIHQFQRPGAGL